MKYIILTVDDRLIYNYTNIKPILAEYNQKCTFYITAKNDLWKTLVPGSYDMTWDQVVALYADGHEIGNHTMNHIPGTVHPNQFKDDIIALNEFLLALDIPKPVSFAYPAFLTGNKGASVVRNLGFKFARIGYPDLSWHTTLHLRTKICHFNPKIHNHHKINITGALSSIYSFEQFKHDLDQVPEDTYAIFVTHCVAAKKDILMLINICNFIAKSPNLKMIRMCDIKC